MGFARFGVVARRQTVPIDLESRSRIRPTVILLVSVASP